MSRLPTPGGDDGTWGDILNDFLGVEHNADGTLKKDSLITGAEQTANKGQPSGYASLDSGGNVPSSQLNNSPAAADATTLTKGVVQLAGDLGGTATSPTVPGLTTKATDTAVVHLAGTESVTGDKDFTGALTHNSNAVVDTTDSRLTNARTPTAHESTHLAGGSDALPWTTIHGSGLASARPAAASTNAGYLYLATDTNGGTLYRSDGSTWTQIAAGVSSGGGGSVATDTIWNAKGDLAVGTGADTASILSVGSDSQVLMADSTQTTGIKWAASAATAAALGWTDATASPYNAKTDLTRKQNGVISSGSSTLTGTFAASNGDAGKLIVVLGAGTATSRSDGAMTTGAATVANILTSAGASFTQSLVGQVITVAGAGASGGTLTARVWGVISSTQLRLTSNCSTTVSAASYTISADLYATITASSATTATLNTSAGTTISSGGEYWFGTDNATAINSALSALPGNGGVVWLPPGGYAVGSAITTTGASTWLLGSGGQGYSRTLGFGATRIMPLKANIVAYRFGTGRVVDDAAISSGSTTLTSATANFSGGDVGSTISVIGAGALAGSSTQTKLETTVSSVTNSTTVTLAAAASTTVSNAYSTVASALNNNNAGPGLAYLHFIGTSGVTGGIHIINANNAMLHNVTASDFYGGFGCYADGTGGNCQYWDIRGCNFNDNYIGFKSFKTAMTINGCTFDGHSNLVNVVPGPGTVGVDSYNGIHIIGSNLQSYETCLRSDGNSGGAVVRCFSCRFESFVTGVQQGSDTSGGNGAYIDAGSWSTSSVGGAASTAIKLLASVKNTVINPGYWVPGNLTATSIDGSVLNTIDLSQTMIAPSNSGPSVVVRTSDSTALQSQTTPQQDDTLSFAVVASGVYWFEARLLFSGDATMDVKVEFTGPSGTTMQWGADGNPANNIAGWGTPITTSTPLGEAGAAGTVSAGLINGSNQGTTFAGLVYVGATAGTVHLLWSQATSEAANLVLKTGSHIKYWRLS